MFPDDDDPTYDSPIDGLAGGLDTLVTSEYNYARHLRDLCLDTLSAGDKAESSYKSYLYTVSCGKFLNTLLLLTLRKAKALESFRWNIRVELSRPVYKALHEIASLGHLRIRMPSGPSLYETPPPLPLPWGNTNAHYGSSLPPPVPPMPTLTAVPQGTVTIQSLVAGQPFTYGPPPISAPLTVPHSAAPKHSPKPRLPTKQEPAKEPPTLSGFKNLETLAVLDIDFLHNTSISELKTCVQNSASTLKKLELSFSDSLALKARKPCLADPNESDEDDEFQVVPMNSSYDDASGAAKAIRAQVERQSQETILGRVLGVEPCVVGKACRKEDKSPTAEEVASNSAADDYVANMRKVSERLLAHVHGTSDFSEAEDVLESIVQAAKKFTETIQGKNVEAPPPGPEGSKSNETPMPKPASGTAQSAKTSAHGHAKQGEADPEDIDVAAPEASELVVEPQEDGSTEPAAKDVAPSVGTRSATPDASSSSAAHTSMAVQPSNGSTTPRKVRFDLPGSAPSTDADAEKLKLHEMNIVEAEIEDANEDKESQSPDDKEELRRQIIEYKRGTRGIALESLSLHLIPTKASVLGRAIDLRSLKRLTLLNVGNQAPIWSLFAKENKLQPLPLTRIFTDHVSLPFLHLVAKLDCVHELFMLERNSKYRPESFAPKSKINLEQIRRFALKKHMHTIKYLVIRNSADELWDLDIKTVQLICRQGKSLEELGITMGIRAVVGSLSTLMSPQKLTLVFQHAFAQYMSSLVRLRALHIISFRNEDTCLSVVRETRQFIVDTMSQHPDLPLEWISMGEADRAERIIRHPDMDENGSQTKRKKTKGKGKEVMVFPDDNYPYLPVEDESESEDDDDQWRLKLELESAIPFWEVYGVRIWEKEVLSGRL